MNSGCVALIIPSGREMEKGLKGIDESTVLLKADNHFHRIDVTFIFYPWARHYDSKQPGIPQKNQTTMKERSPCETPDLSVQVSNGKLIT